MNLKCSSVYSKENKTPFPDETPIGMTYVPFQQWEAVYPENTAFERGTIFPSLYLPFSCQEVNNDVRK